MMTAETAINTASPSNGNVQEVISAAQHQLNQLLRQRAEIMKRIGTVKQTLTCLAQMFGDEQLSPEVLRLLGRGTARKPGFTRACRVILMEATLPLEARQGLREMQRRFPELIERHKDPLASITTVFTRLVDYSEARSSVNTRGRRAWEWIAEPTDTDTSVLRTNADVLSESVVAIRNQ